MCPRCHAYVEDKQHAFFSCPETAQRLYHMLMVVHLALTEADTDADIIKKMINGLEWVPGNVTQGA